MALSDNEVIINNSRREIKPQGTPGFPCAAYERLMSNEPGDVIIWHYHEEMELISICSGEVLVKFVSKEVRVSAGEMILINSSTLHFVSSFTNTVLHSFVFSPLLITSNSSSSIAVKYVTPLVNCSCFTYLKWKGSQNELNLFNDAFEDVRNDVPGYELRVRDVLGRFVFDAYLHFQDSFDINPQKADLDTVRITKMLHFIHQNYQKHISLKMIADAGEIGEREALRCFKRSIGESPVQYLLKYRLMKSADLLKQNRTISISDAAYECGFDSQSYYTKKFHEIYHCTPREFIKKNHEKSA